MQAGSSSKLNSRAQRGKGQQNGAAITVSPVASPPARVIVNKHKPEYEHVLVDARIRRTYEIARNKFEDYLRVSPRDSLVLRESPRSCTRVAAFVSHLLVFIREKFS